jgi:hypothetical protein
MHIGLIFLFVVYLTTLTVTQITQNVSKVDDQILGGYWGDNFGH